MMDPDRCPDPGHWYGTRTLVDVPVEDQHALQRMVFQKRTNAHGYLVVDAVSCNTNGKKSGPMGLPVQSPNVARVGSPG